LGWVCHAVRAPGVKWTLLALSRAEPDGAATASMNTVPVNQSVGPGVVETLVRVTSIRPINSTSAVQAAMRRLR